MDNVRHYIMGSKGSCAMADRKIDLGVSASSFIEGTNDAFIVQVDGDASVGEIEVRKDVYDKLEGYTLKPANILARASPVVGEPPGIPFTIKPDPYTP